MKSEVWKDIKGYEGLYQASNLGRIKSLDRIVIQKCKWGSECNHIYKGKNFIREWNSIKEAETKLNIKNINKCCKGKLKTFGGFIWEYKEENNE